MKVDFEKAFDCVSWNYLKYLMKRMGFRNRLLSWMNAYVFSSTMHVLMNGSLTKELQVGTGLLQGDPLSPFLFLLVVEGLSSIVSNSTIQGKYLPFKVCKNLHLRVFNLQTIRFYCGKGRGKTCEPSKQYRMDLSWFQS